MRWYGDLKSVVVLGVLMSGMIGCSYHNDRGHDHGGPHGGGPPPQREDVYVHQDGPPPHYHDHN